jgi:hypothetical protein
MTTAPEQREALVFVGAVRQAVNASQGLVQIRRPIAEALLDYLERQAGLVEQPPRPICEECNEEMNPFTLPDGRDAWGCDGCGWSIP